MERKFRNVIIASIDLPGKAPHREEYINTVGASENLGGVMVSMLPLSTQVIWVRMLF